MSVLQKVMMERTSLLPSRKTDLPRFLNPTKHFSKYQTIEATSLFFILKTQKVSSFQNVITPKSHSGTHIIIPSRKTDLPRFLNPAKHFPKYQTIEVASLFFILKTQKVSSFQNVITPKMPSGTHIIMPSRKTDLPRFLNPAKHFPKYQTIEVASLFFILKTQKHSSLLKCLHS